MPAVDAGIRGRHFNIAFRDFEPRVLVLFEDLFVVGCEALFVVWVGKVVPNPVL
jgi:hypothetical protein